MQKHSPFKLPLKITMKHHADGKMYYIEDSNGRRIGEIFDHTNADFILIPVNLMPEVRAFLEHVKKTQEFYNVDCLKGLEATAEALLAKLPEVDK